jgi:hypothetical protein
MHSGGGLKDRWSQIYIEADEEVALNVFRHMFGHDPLDVACDCCGQNYSLRESSSLEQASGFHRGCAWEGDGYAEKQDPQRKYQRYQTIASWLASQREGEDGHRVIFADEWSRAMYPGEWDANDL